jgi:acetyl-CoA C-acetyltransferase
VPPDDGTWSEITAPAMFSLLAPAYAKKYGVDPDELKEVMTRIAWKNHFNGARNPRAQFRKEVRKETICNAPLWPASSASSTARACPTARRRRSSCRAEDAHRTPTSPST